MGISPLSLSRFLGEWVAITSENYIVPYLLLSTKLGLCSYSYGFLYGHIFFSFVLQVLSNILRSSTMLKKFYLMFRHLFHVNEYTTTQIWNIFLEKSCMTFNMQMISKTEECISVSGIEGA